MINQLTLGVNRPEVKGYAYCHTFCGHEWPTCIMTSRTRAGVNFDGVP